MNYTMRSKVWTTSFRKVVVSYLLVFLLPLIVLSALTDRYLLSKINSDAMASNLKEVSFVAETVGSQYEQMNSIHNSLLLDANIALGLEPSDYAKVDVLMMRLRTHLQSMSALDNLGLYCEGGKYLYTARSSYTLPLFFSIYQTGLSDTLIAQLQRGAAKRQTLLVRNTMDMQEYVLFLMPVSLNFGQAQRTTLFLVRTDAYRNMYARALGTNAGCVFMTNAQGEPISGCTSDVDESLDTFARACLDKLPGVISNLAVETEHKLNGRSYLVTILPSLACNAYFILITSTQTLLSDALAIRTLWFTGISALLVVGFALVMITANRIYLPIRKIKCTVPTGAVDEGAPGNDFKFIESYIGYLNTKGEELNRQLTRNRKDVNDYIAFKLFKGEADGLEEMLPRLARPLEWAAIVLSAELHEKKPMLDTLGTLAVECGGDNALFMRDLPGTGIAVAIGCVGGEEAWETLLMRLRARLRTSLGIGARGSMESIPHSLLQAMLATSQATYCVYTDEAQSKDMQKALTNVQELYGGDFASFTAFRQRMELQLSEMQSEGLMLPEVRLLCGYLLSALKRFLKENGEALPELPDVFCLLSCINVNSATAVLYNALQQATQRVINSSLKDRSLLIDEMTDYLSAHHNDLNLSLQSMAAAFEMSTPILTKYFKDSTGKTMLEYVTDIRIGRACELLRCTSLAIKDVGMEVGFINVTSFIRRFKQLKGNTPGNYRRQDGE